MLFGGRGGSAARQCAWVGCKQSTARAVEIRNPKSEMVGPQLDWGSTLFRLLDLLSDEHEFHDSLEGGIVRHGRDLKRGRDAVQADFDGEIRACVLAIDAQAIAAVE